MGAAAAPTEPTTRPTSAMPTLIQATPADIPAVVVLMNRAYRATGPTPGWTHESAYIEGDRTTEPFLRQDLAANPAARLLLWREPPAPLQGCVWLEPLADDHWYLGSLTIEPGAQNTGLGRQLLAAAEAWVAARGGRAIKMTVVQIRTQLIAWYERRGYHLTAETEPFPYTNPRFGKPTRPDLHFAVLRKHFYRATTQPKPPSSP